VELLASIMKNFDSLCKGYGITASPESLKQMARYVDFLFEWNKKINLVSRKLSREAFYQKHILDSLLVPLLLKWDINKPKDIADFGSGGGLPGIPLAILCPCFRIVLVESIEKKAFFLKQAIGKLGLENVSLLSRRIETIQTPTVYDVILSRGVGSLKENVRICSSLLKSHGDLVVFKGASFQAEISGLKPEPRHSIEICPYLLPSDSKPRHLVVLKKVD